MFSTGRFAYYPVMSPYEAEAALGKPRFLPVILSDDGGE
jgi:hypothetical protein